MEMPGRNELELPTLPAGDGTSLKALVHVIRFGKIEVPPGRARSVGCVWESRSADIGTSRL